jgi:hypothetical protein
MRLFLEAFARKSNFDSLVANNWYRVSRRHIQQTKVNLFSSSSLLEDIELVH